MIYLALIGGCSGSTSGGIKVIRLVVLLKESKNILKQFIHPSAILSVNVEKTTYHLSLSTW